MGFTQLQLVKLNDKLFSAIYTVSAGNVNNRITFRFDDDSGSLQSVTTPFVLNSKRPSANGRPTTNRGSCSDGTFKKNDKLEITHKLTSASNGETMYADLSSLGLGYVDMGANGTTFSCSVTMPANKEGTNLSFPVTCMNEAGNSVTWTSASINYDTIAPVLQSCTAVNMTSGKQYATVGDTIKIQAIVSKWDNDILTASNSFLFPGGPVIMEKVSGDTIGATAIYEYVHYVTEEDIANVNTCFEISASDDAENTVKKNTNFIKLDTLPPEFKSLAIKIDPSNGLLSNTAIIDDHIVIYGELSQLMPDVSLFVDLSAIGGVSNQLIPFTDGSTAPKVATASFYFNYTIGQYTSEHNTPRAFTVTAKDIAGNTVTQVTMPVIYVDNLPPTISGAQFQNVTNPNQPVKLGDQISITATVGNPDNGSVYTDISRLGGSSRAELSLYSGNTYRLDHIVGESTDPASPGGQDKSMSFVVYAQDDGGNIVNTTTGSLMVDSEPPVILNATYSVSPALSSTHQYVRAGDRITFKVQLASSTSNIHDGETVTMDLSAFEGQSANTELIYAGGVYTYSCDVPAGQLNYEHVFNAVAKDNAGNTANRGISVKIDNQKPVVGVISVKFLNDAVKKDIINIGDRLEISIPVTDADEGYCSIDLSIIGSSSTAIIPFSHFDSALSRYYIVVDCKEASMENPSYIFSANVYDKAGNMQSGVSQPFSVDCCPPVINDFSIIHTKKKGKKNVVNVGDQLKFSVEVEPSTFDESTVTVNLSKLGGSSAQKLEDMGDNIYSYTYTVEEGDTDGEMVAFKAKVTDNAGNFVEKTFSKNLFVDNCPVKIDSINYAQTIDTNGNDIVDLDGTFVTTPVYATDSVTLTVNLSANASVTVDLTKFGYGNTAYPIEVVTSPAGYKAEAEIMPKRGTTNNEPVKLTVTVTDENGNQTVVETDNSINVDNKAPVITVSPITFTYDTGRAGEANKGDVIEVKANITGNDDLSPILDMTNIYASNGLTPPSGTIMNREPGTNTYSAKFNVPEGLGTKSRFAIIAVDKSGNMSVAETDTVRFMSKIPTLGESTATLYFDENANGILNPGDQVRVDCYLTDGFEENNTPPAKVVADIGGITDMEGTKFYTGNVENPEKRCWAELDYDPEGSGSGKYHYYKVFTASGTTKVNRGLDADDIQFIFRVLHPETESETISSVIVTGSFPVDTKLPYVTASSIKMNIVDEYEDNTASYSANIGDFLEIKAEIKAFDDAGSATAVLYMPTSGEILGFVPMTRATGTENWVGNFVVATGTRRTGEQIGEGEWRIINDGIVRLKIFATDDADNTISSNLTTPSPTIKMDNFPPEIFNDNSTFVKFIDTNADGSLYLNVENGLATDSLWAQVTINEFLNASAGKGKAYIDLSPIGATSTYMLSPKNTGACDTFQTIETSVYTDKYIHFVPQDEVDLASLTFKIWVVDASGNKSFWEDIAKPVPFDTARPSIESVTYNGLFLTINFSEKIRPSALNVDNIRIGRANVSGVRQMHKDEDVNQGTAIKLSSVPLYADLDDYDHKPELSYDTNSLIIQLGKTTRSKIADWGPTKLFISIASIDDEPGEITNKLDSKYGPMGLDTAGNWLRPILRSFPKEISITETFTERPKLVSGYWNADSTEIDSDYLFLRFNKGMDKTTLTEESISKLAIWYNTTSQSELWNVRYRMRGGFDTFNQGDSFNTASCDGESVGIKLSQEAKDWIALVYGKSASQIRLQINDSEYNPPAFIRDTQGNRIEAVTPGNAVIATLKPLVSPFSMTSDVTLDLSSETPLLTIHFNNRRARLFKDVYSATSLDISKNTPADLSRIYICSNASVNTGDNICLGTSGTTPAMVNWNSGATSYTALNDYASTTVRIPLTDTALNTILKWGTDRFYLRCENGAFQDLWGNLSEAFTDTSNGAGEINTSMPSGSAFSEPRIMSVALTPIVEGMTGVTLFKGNSANSFFYEVAFETATISSDIRVPISRSITPTLRLYTQAGAMVDENGRMTGGTLVDSGTFVGWGEHNQGGINRTYIRFTSSGLAESGSLQREPVYVRVEGFTDIFRTGQSFSDSASFSYDLAKKMETTAYPTGFNQVASYPMEFDNCAPIVLTATSTIGGAPLVNNIIGVTAKNNMKVSVEFNEDMYQSTSTSLTPTLKLVTNSGSTIMTYKFESWSSTKTAVFTNNAVFDSNTTQGEAYFYVSGGYDQAGNALADTKIPESVFIRSRGATINAISVKTLQYTTANSADDYKTDVAFSPSVSSNYYDKSASGIATITVTFATAPDGTTGKIKIYTIDGGTLVRTLEAYQASSGTEWYAEWDGTRDDGTLITSNYQITYLIKFIDENGNEGSRSGKIIYDNSAPKVIEWEFPNLNVVNNTAYFSPTALTSARINCITGDLGQTMKMRLSRPNPDDTMHDIVNTYIMASYGNSGYTIAFDGNGSVNSTEALTGSWTIDLVDTAGNIGIGLNSSSKPVSGIVIDRTAPYVTGITLQRVLDDMTPVGALGIDRFNARLHNLKIMIADGTVTDEPLDEGTGVVKIMSGSTLVRKMFTHKTGSDLYAVWDGNDDKGSAVPDGTYTIKVTDLAGNEATMTKEVTLIRTLFSLTGVEQVGLDSIKMVFNQKVDSATTGVAYTISPVNPPGLMITNAVVSSEQTIVLASLTPALTVSQHNVEYTVTVPADTVKSIDGDSITAGNNTAKFTADTKGPSIVAITYDGLTSQKQFNIVFDEQVESASAVNVANYKLKAGATDIPITSVILRSDNKSVTITSSSDVGEGVNYTVIVKGVKDVSGNLSDTTITFEGRDITPPVLTVTAFSTPANERDIIIAVKSNEDISDLPTAIISQSGAVANSIQLSSSGNNRMFTGGYHLNSNYAGVATIKVTASDMSNNVGTANYSFTTAYVSASVRASITSADRLATAVFEKGSLTGNSVVMMLTEPLEKSVTASNTLRASIAPAVVTNMTTNERASMRASVTVSNSDLASTELVPLSHAYNLVVPSARMSKPARFSISLTEEQKAVSGVGIYENTSEGWKLVKANIASGTATFNATANGVYAVMQDTMAPRASLENDLSKVIKTAKPTFTWNLQEYASGINKESIRAVLDGKENDVVVSDDGSVVKFTPKNLVSGNHELTLKVSDLAGNRASMEVSRFASAIPLRIEDVSCYPNPARRYSKIRFKVSGSDINADEITIKVYDVAGHLVADSGNIDMRGARSSIFEATWDLHNKKGKRVANGTYIAKIEVRDPLDWGKKAKFTLKIAVLK